MTENMKENDNKAQDDPVKKDHPTEIYPTKRNVKDLAEHQERIKQIAQKINIEDPKSVENFGLNLQNQTQNVAKQVLENAKARDLGPIKQNLVALASKMEMVPDDKQNKGLFHRIFRKGQQTGLEWYNSTLKVQGLVDAIGSNLKKQADKLQNSNDINQAMFDDNGKLYHILSDYIEAGEKSLEDIRAKQLPNLQKEIDRANPADKPIMRQKYQLVSDNINRLQKRLADLASVRQLVYTTGPELLLIRNSNQLLIDQINDAISMKIPAWEKGLGIHMSIMDQKAALDMKKDFDDKTDKLLTQIAHEVHDNSVKIVENSGETSIKVETLKEINNTILDTVKDCNKAAINSEKQQREAIKTIKSMTDDFQKALADINENNVKQLEDSHEFTKNYLLSDNSKGSDLKSKNDMSGDTPKGNTKPQGYKGIDWDAIEK